MHTYDGLTAYFGDLHNHCGISYGHGSLDAAFRNAREQLDFCSVTGHALWPDMPEPDEDVQYIIDFHEEGFARLRERWPAVQQMTEDEHQAGEFVTFLSFEMHSCADGDYTVVYKGARGEILEVAGLEELRERVRALRQDGVGILAFPHHIGYCQGQRGINWQTFQEDLSPVVEIISMHGCSEADENTRPFLHVMGPSDHESTMQYGLAQGHFFGVIGSTDHHSAYPGSYGHGRTGVWARAKTREAIWDALMARRTYALTGDRIELKVALNDAPMGARVASVKKRTMICHVLGGAPIDYVDIVKNGALVRRFSEYEILPFPKSDLLRTKIYLQVGWGERGVHTDWDVRLGISDGYILAVEPRFRGPEVVAPTESAQQFSETSDISHWDRDGARGVRFNTATFGNPNNATDATQGICLDVEMPLEAEVQAVINGRDLRLPLRYLMEGARAGRLRKIGSAGYRFNRAPRRREFDWLCGYEDNVPRTSSSPDVYYVRVRQKNDQWAWSSPIRVE